ncbi:IS1 family transposase [Sorangium sp. So ce321]|uniref:IS1 family transposase n=1 Tax=Sorangium sp. So ce321 TaxID=3133300 RepID=UPI003F6117C7
MANMLPRERQLAVLAALIDGNSERATERMTGVQQKTIGRFALRIGKAAQSLHNTMAHDLSCSLIESDEVWSFIKKKQARVTPEENAAGLGEAYTFTALAMPSRYVVTWYVGKRDEVSANAFIADLRSRLVVMPSLTSDGFTAYPGSIGSSFGPGVDFAQVIKHFTRNGHRDDDHRYEPPRNPFLTKRVVFGAPNIDAATTAHVERNNGTMRHHIGRMRRLCYAFSKDVDRHKAAVALGYVHYNLCHVLKTTRVTPAMGAGVTNHIWELAELLEALLSVPEMSAPSAKPLAPRKPEGTARELPRGRGWLRVVGGAGGPAAPSPATPPAAPPAAVMAPAAPALARSPVPAAVVPPPEPAAEMAGQLDLFAWKPRHQRPVQLSLFGDDCPRE